MDDKVMNEILQRHRKMSPSQYKRITKDLEISRAASARFLDVSEKTAYRYAHGGPHPIPAPTAMLLGLLWEYGVTPAEPTQ